MLSLHHELTTCLREGGADLVGFANLDGLVQDKKKVLPFGISIGVALNPRTISKIRNRTKSIFSRSGKANYMPMNSNGRKQRARGQENLSEHIRKQLLKLLQEIII